MTYFENNVAPNGAQIGHHRIISTIIPHLYFDWAQ